ncbi:MULTISPECIES: hypothetical protein [unclassified Pseudomonas]|uniref:hypothetical protein n=1 Tax=unclassified Pseudomonas TaxID=196821 RepID=UPI0011A4C183|nr:MULTISPECIES: hypothetical protein [unclassified Pseudomonas]TWC13362.1 hypothetical protein FBY00_1217 [Pseudomonas sp. SJZ075]TWC29660.1 hypothetical protein FBY02_1217 [Pseudomonas sp. SJZ078]TWC50346.1 hypothetical protein FBY11_1207 [Pseudomonas sp. SJZ124]TWC86154.1 hypothetical protein FBY09_12170 [Pseudomonas sp. SJZ101]
MNAAAELKAWNFQVLMLVQAMLGAVTPNFRMVVLSREDNMWVIKFYLEKHVEDDIDEIEDVICQYTAYQDSDLICKSEILVGNEKLPSLSETDRVIYRRKE